MDELIEKIKQLIEEEEEVGKVTFEFKETDPEVLIIANRRALLMALAGLRDYRRHLYKYGDDKAIIIEDLDDGTKKIITDEMMEKERMDSDINPLEKIEKRHSYIKEQDVIDKIDDLLDGVYSLIEDY